MLKSAKALYFDEWVEYYSHHQIESNSCRIDLCCTLILLVIWKPLTLLKEAERKVRGRVELLQKRRGRQELVVIVGRGTHSEDGVSRLQPAIMTLLEESQGWASYQNVPVPLLTLLSQHCFNIVSLSIRIEFVAKC